jgi:hypothetical protein
MEDLLASAQNIALGSFLFRADHFVLKRHSFGIVFCEPGLRDVSRSMKRSAGRPTVL